jgi:hypothetical protein
VDDTNKGSYQSQFGKIIKLLTLGHNNVPKQA